MNSPEEGTRQSPHNFSLMPQVTKIALLVVAVLISILKAAVVLLPVIVIIAGGCTGCALGVLPLHVKWTYRAIWRRRKLSVAGKVAASLVLPVLLLLWPIAVLVGSLVLGVAYGLSAPFSATLDVVRRDDQEGKLTCSQFLLVGTYSSLEGACTVVRDFGDYIIHSYFDYLEDLEGEKPPLEETEATRDVEAGSSKVGPDHVKEQAMGPLKSPSASPGGILGMLGRSPSTAAAVFDVKNAHVWDSLFRHFHFLGEELADAGVVREVDIKDWLAVKRSSGASIASKGLVSLALLQILNTSHKKGSRGLVISDNLEIMRGSKSRDQLLQFFLEPLLDLRDQLQALDLSADDERYLEALVVSEGEPERQQLWLQEAAVPSTTSHISGLARRIQGIGGSVTRFPAFRRRHTVELRNLLKYIKRRQGRDAQRVQKSFSEPRSNGHGMPGGL